MINLRFYKSKIGDFATNSNFLIPRSSQPDDVNFGYFKLRLFDLT